MAAPGPPPGWSEFSPKRPWRRSSLPSKIRESIPDVILIGRLRDLRMALPESLEEAAIIDGATPLQTLIKIVVPLSTAATATIGLFYAVWHWNEWFYAFLYINDTAKLPLQGGGTLHAISSIRWAGRNDPSFAQPAQGRGCGLCVRQGSQSMVIDLVLNHQWANPKFVPQIVDVAKRNGSPDVLCESARRSEKLGCERARCSLVPSVSRSYESARGRRAKVVKEQ